VDSRGVNNRICGDLGKERNNMSGTSDDNELEGNADDFDEENNYVGIFRR
jgi:hypothetical protein